MTPSPAEPVTVFIGLGSNLGDRERHLCEALEQIRSFVSVEKVSSVYETEPVGLEDQAWFLNMVVKGTTRLTASQLLARLQATEHDLGRRRTVKHGPRTIDLDILFYSDTIRATERLVIPHPEVHHRGFVLKPLHEIEPDLVHPKLQQNIRSLLNSLQDDKRVKKWTGRRSST